VVTAVSETFDLADVPSQKPDNRRAGMGAKQGALCAAMQEPKAAQMGRLEEPSAFDNEITMMPRF
jgi:hypothetical protein